MTELRLFTSESVTEGHPDKVCDTWISDAILDGLLEQDRKARVAVETMVTTGLVHVAGEVNTGYVEIPQIIRSEVRTSATPPTSASTGTPAASRSPSASSHPTSRAASTTRGGPGRGDPRSYDLQGAEDQGLMVGYACTETPTMLLPIHPAHRLTEHLAYVRRENVVEGLRPTARPR